MSASTGQVKTPAPNKMSAYAAARATDQVSFGATPALVAQLQQMGLSAWIDQQMAMPLSLTDTPTWVIDYDETIPEENDRVGQFVEHEAWSRVLTAPDQLRRRVAWAMSQFVPVNSSPHGHLEWINLLQRHAFGNYGEFLHEISIDPSMGVFLNNVENRPRSTDCPTCTPNENYARELLQLFSLGVVQLELDGSVVRDAQGKAKETYTQNDVEELARALTGWRTAPSATPLSKSNWNNVGHLMVPETRATAHDSGAKTVMNSHFAAGGDAPQDLRATVAMLMKHPNIAPFVSLRLIQHLVTSDPTPAYIARVATVFRNNGLGVAGDMKATVRAVLLDSEARRGDQLNGDTPHFGKFREPLVWRTALLRGLGCKAQASWSETNVNVVGYSNQSLVRVPSVFGYYQATDRAPGSNLLAPEQKLFDTIEMTERLGRLTTAYFGRTACDIAPLSQALATSPDTFIDMVSTRWFRGAMPPTLRSKLHALATTQRNSSTPEQNVLVLLQYALTTAHFGVIK